ncbi:hypothetical protein [Fundicoccus culcitae]|uniref:Antitoxin n=1 Tax=Fundicoccus culcitae TaxID=2969821 RepID=A0ABY5P2S3_9LACT|nr:hypothetical protein [Fundicoccus culcitae]UUX32780.1 hypothetical protein NRE15_07560 [Fundicoccus culcitae]
MTNSIKIYQANWPSAEIEKDPLKFFEMSKEMDEPIYVVNNDERIGVMLDINVYHRSVTLIQGANEYLARSRSDIQMAELERQIEAYDREKDESSLRNEALSGEYYHEWEEEYYDYDYEY